MKKQIIEGDVTSKFGVRKDPITTNSWKQHNGVDIAAPIGTKIIAPFDVIVMDIFEHFSGGLTLILADEKRTLRVGMCHLSSISVYVGQNVKKRSLLAHSGNTGSSTGPHLHLSLQTGGFWLGNKYNNGTFMDPQKILILESETI